jgi:uncharacterized phage protein (TIGR01671 family)
MQREIKFRAWDKEEKKMWFANTENKNNEKLNLSYKMNLMLTMNGEIRICHWYNNFDNNLSMFGDSRYELMQFIGFKDNNFKEIYEGDIIHHKDSDTREIDGVITFIKGAYGIETKEGFWTFNALIGQDTEMYIVGNIFENPELAAKII